MVYNQFITRNQQNKQAIDRLRVINKISNSGQNVIAFVRTCIGVTVTPIRVMWRSVFCFFFFSQNEKDFIYSTHPQKYLFHKDW